MTANKKAIRDWEKANLPMAKEKLAISARISVKTAEKVLRGDVPSQMTRYNVSQAMGVPEHELYPVVTRKTA